MFLSDFSVLPHSICCCEIVLPRFNYIRPYIYFILHLILHSLFRLRFCFYIVWYLLCAAVSFSLVLPDYQWNVLQNLLRFFFSSSLLLCRNLIQFCWPFFFCLSLSQYFFAFSFFFLSSFWCFRYVSFSTFFFPLNYFNWIEKMCTIWMRVEAKYENRQKAALCRTLPSLRRRWLRTRRTKEESPNKKDEEEKKNQTHTKMRKKTKIETNKANTLNLSAYVS